jgi:NAD(P)-dependent dehydrogenase (short-subunit alcohol dehydrogenase family)
VEAALRKLQRERELRQNLADLRESGARVEYVALDVRDEAGMKHLIDRIYRERGRLDAVVHGAGVIEDKLVRDKTPESFDRVVHTKADSSFLLSRLLRPESLRCLIFMSSISAAFGNYGQADYAAANGYFNGFACKLAAEWPCRVVAMNWGPWDQTGMVSEGLREQFQNRGVQLIPVQSGVDAIVREIEGAGTDPVVILGDGPWMALAQSEAMRDDSMAMQMGAGI